MANRALLAIARQVGSLREEETREDSWFALPEDGDDDVNWMDFEVDIAGSKAYGSNPKGGDAERLSPFRDGVFRVNIKMPVNYPHEAPDIVFKTRVWHPNIHLETLRPCMNDFRESWKPTMTVRDVLCFVRELLGQPNGADCVNREAGSEFLSDVDAFDRHAEEETAKYASPAV